MNPPKHSEYMARPIHMERVAGWYHVAAFANEDAAPSIVVE
jgi:hypothetical protein